MKVQLVNIDPLVPEKGTMMTMMTMKVMTKMAMEMVMLMLLMKIMTKMVMLMYLDSVASLLLVLRPSQDWSLNSFFRRS